MQLHITNLLRLRCSKHSIITSVGEAQIVYFSPKVLRQRCFPTHHQICIIFDAAVLSTNLLKLRCSTYSFNTSDVEAETSPKVLRLRCCHTDHQSFLGFSAAALVANLLRLKCWLNHDQCCWGWDDVLITKGAEVKWSCHAHHQSCFGFNVAAFITKLAEAKIQHPFIHYKCRWGWHDAVLISSKLLRLNMMLH